VSSPSGSATKVSREIFGLKFFRIVSRQLAIACFHPQENDRLKFGQDLLPLTKFGCPGAMLVVQPLEPMLPDFGQADPVQGITPRLEGVLALFLFPL